MNLEDTIVAISTPVGKAGIGIVRMSGKKAFSIAQKIFVPPKNSKICWTSSFKMYYGWIVDPQTGERLDEVLLSLMKAPRTYTREDIVEINCHGGALVLRKTLELCMNQGARLAEPGEFTRRAFLNGRIDLSQAESVLEIVEAKTEKSLQRALKNLEGKFSNHILSLRNEMIDILSSIEAEIDFCEEDIKIIPPEEKKKRLNELLHKIDHLLDQAKTSQIFREGIKLVIAGRTNVGKSSLLNTLLERERAIVSEIPGTTRDTIEEAINIKGFPVIIVDTAGLEKVKDPLREEGVRRAHLSLKQADLVLLMIDGSSPLKREDKEIFYLLKNIKKKFLTVINKIDLPQKIKKSKIKEFFPHLPLIEISATRGDNLDKLKDKIAEMILKQINVNSENFMINLRQKKCLEKAKEYILKAREALETGLSEEFLSLELRESIRHLDEIRGTNLQEEVLDRIFSNFCIGK